MDARAIDTEIVMIQLFCFLIFGLVAGLCASTVHAGSFCLGGPGVAPQCIYDDINTCKKNADPPNTNCFVNGSSDLNQQGNAPYCLVTSQRIAECIYVDRGQCNMEASRKGGICRDNTGNDSEENPYRYDTRIQN